MYANKDVKAVIRGVMRHLMTKTLMGQCSWKGSRGKKRSFVDTRLHGLIRGRYLLFYLFFIIFDVGCFVDVLVSQSGYCVRKLRFQ